MIIKEDFKMDERILNIILACIPVFMGVITYFVLPLLKAKIGDANVANITKWITYAVEAAEMIYKAETGKGLEKKQYVVDFIDNMFNAKKEVISKEQINVIIEAVLAELDGITVNTNKIESK
jgi:hypothetical protein